MLRRSSGSKSSGDHNWRRLWETPSKKSHRRYAIAWVHPIPSDLPFSEALVVPVHFTEPSEFITMPSNPANRPIEDQFLRWRQEMEAMQEEHAKQMAELREHLNRLQQENERLRAHLETNRAKNSLRPTHPAPPALPNKGKEPILIGESDPSADDELSFGISPLLDHSPPQNNVEVDSKKRPPCQFSRSVSGARRQVRREAQQR